MTVKTMGPSAQISREAEAFHPGCPVEGSMTMRLEESGPMGVRWICRDCGVVLVMPRVALVRALRKTRRWP